jgi:site-specific recombinase XerD
MSPAELIPAGVVSLAALPTDLADQAEEYQRASKSAATVRAYGSDWRDFTAWCLAHGLHSLPAPEDAVIGYLTDLARQGRKASTIARRVSAVSQAHQAAHFEPPTRSLAVRATMGGIRRTLGTAPTRKRALMVDDLRSMLATLDGSGRGGELRGIRDRAILLLGFAAGMRRSELVGLDVSDIEEAPEGLRVTLRRSKTDQEGQGRAVGVWRGRHADTDPVAAALAWRTAAALTDGPLFRPVSMIDGSLGAGRLTARNVARLVQRAAGLAGLDAAAYGGHSLRAGFATSAARAGAHERDIARQTGHRSMAILRGYIRAGSLFQHNPSADLGL